MTGGLTDGATGGTSNPRVSDFMTMGSTESVEERLCGVSRGKGSGHRTKERLDESTGTTAVVVGGGGDGCETIIGGGNDPSNMGGNVCGPGEGVLCNGEKLREVEKEDVSIYRTTQTKQLHKEDDDSCRGLQTNCSSKDSGIRVKSQVQRADVK